MKTIYDIRYTKERKKIIFIVGPTASGKTALAVRLARKIGGEIISCDSMQVYKGLPILSAQPKKQELKGVKYHLVGVLDISREFNMEKFVRLAKSLLKGIHRKGKPAIIVGGTGLYMSGLLDGVFKGPAKDTALRKELENKAQNNGLKSLHDELKKVDLEAALKIHPNDLRRIIRALEVYWLTGKPISELQKEKNGLWQDNRYAIVVFGINVPKEELYSKINKRVDLMFRQGVQEEVKKALKKKCSKTLRQALGIKEIGACLRGELKIEEAKELLKLNTRHYAKRQLTWFRRDERIKWVDVPIDLKQIISLVG